MFSHVKFAELPVIDQDRALKFYTRTLELDLVTDTPYRAGWRWIEIAIPGAATKILFSRRAGPPRQDEPAIVLVVNDVEATAAELLKRGIRFDQAPGPAPWDAKETFALFRDSEDNIVMIGSK